MASYFFRYILILILLGFTTLQANAKRMALVIGNDDYQEISKLTKAVNDSKALAITLKDLGFDVTHVKNLDRRNMNRTIQTFAAKIEVGDEALFYYAGHGIEIRGRNYLLPTDIPKASPGNEGFVTNEGFEVNGIIETLRERGSRVNIVILDACRDNPFPRKGTRSLGSAKGLRRTEPPKGTFVMYSAGLDQAALDSLGENDPHPNSVYTRKLLPLLKEPGLSINAMAKKLRGEVEDLAKSIQHDQYPAYYDQVKGDYYFVPGQADVKKEVISATNPDQILWDTISKSDKASDYKFYLNKFPKGTYSAVAELKIQQFAALKESGSSNTDSSGNKRSAPVEIDPKKLAETLQWELKRVGCYDKSIDNTWGQGSQIAMLNYNKHAKSALPAVKPTKEAIESIRKVFARVCPTVQRATPQAATNRNSRASRTAGRKNCRLETKHECRRRICPGGGCGFRGSGRCAPYNRKKICR